MFKPWTGIRTWTHIAVSESKYLQGHLAHIALMSLRLTLTRTAWALISARLLPFLCPVGWGCRIHWLHLCRGVRPPPNECPGYDTKQSDGEDPAMLELWGVRRTPSLPSLPGLLWPGVVAPDKGPIYGLNRINSILMLKWIVWVKLNSLK